MVEAYGHVNLGFTEKDLQKFVDKAGLDVAELRDRHPREAPAAFRSDLADRQRKPIEDAARKTQETLNDTLPWLNPRVPKRCSACCANAS